MNNQAITGVAVAERLTGVEEYYFSQKLGEIDALNKQGKAIINLGIGSPDLAPHADVIKTLAEESVKPAVHGYQSYKGAPALRAAISTWYQTWYGVELDPATEVLPLIGSKEGIMHICMTYLNEGDIALIPNPGYPTYSSAVKLTGAVPVSYELKAERDWMPDFDELKELIKSNKSLNTGNANQDNSPGCGKAVKLMFVNYPHMPTGQLPEPELFRQLVSFAREHNILLVHDNPYSFILNNQPASLLGVEGAKDVVIELNSLSKSHNMAGWRVGMLCGNAQRINEVLRFKSNMDSGMFLPLQLAAAKALTLGRDWHDHLNAIYKERRERVYQLLDALQCIYTADQAGLFVWARIPETCNSGYELSDEVLYNSSVFITPGGIFGTAGNSFVRVSLCTPVAIIQEALQRIQK